MYHHTNMDGFRILWVQEGVNVVTYNRYILLEIGYSLPEEYNLLEQRLPSRQKRTLLCTQPLGTKINTVHAICADST